MARVPVTSPDQGRQTRWPHMHFIQVWRSSQDYFASMRLLIHPFQSPRFIHSEILPYLQIPHQLSRKPILLDNSLSSLRAYCPEGCSCYLAISQRAIHRRARSTRSPSPTFMISNVDPAWDELLPFKLPFVEHGSHDIHRNISTICKLSDCRSRGPRIRRCCADSVRYVEIAHSNGDIHADHAFSPRKRMSARCPLPAHPDSC